ncbi:amidohydrolase family protein [Allosphingosinicella humi]
MLIRRLRSGWLRAAWLLLVGALAAPAFAAPAEEPAGAVAFVRVNVLPMDGERVLSDQTIIVEGGVIRAIGRGLTPPSGATIVDGHGTAYLLPGLADMHSHSETREDLAVYLANGVTTILNMGDASASFIGRTRPAANAGTIPGPHVYAAMVLDGSPRYGHFVVTTPDEARWAVRLARTNGYDFIKVYNNLSAESFQALAAEAREQGVPLVGHTVTAAGGLEQQLAAGQALVAHLEEFLYSYFFAPTEDSGQAAPALARIPDAVAMVKRYGAFVTSDLVTYHSIARQWGDPEAARQLLAMPEVRYLAPGQRLSWPRAGYDKREGSLAARDAFLGHFAKALADAGVPLVTGTDAPSIPGLAPGFSLHDNLALLEQAGLTRYQVLAAATRAPGAFIAAYKPGGASFGTVTTAARADLLLVEANPLEGLETLRRPLGVMAGGGWHDRAGLEAMLEVVADRYRAAVAPSD